jgi:streptogrisin C
MTVSFEQRWMLAATWFCVAICASLPSRGWSGEVGEPVEVNADILAWVMSKNGLDEVGARNVIARQIKAADVYRAVSAASIPGYAGAWFDREKLVLNVGISEEASRSRVERLGAVPIVVARSLNELESIRASIVDASSPLHQRGLLNRTSIHFPDNVIEVVVFSGARDAALSLIPASALEAIRLIESDAVPQFSSTVHGADGTRNHTWAVAYNDVFPCSVGAATENGFYTAGHCGETNDAIRTPSGSSLGSVGGSPLDISIGYYGTADAAWVATSSGWTPEAKINGYGGTINVSGKWSGTRNLPPYFDVCRSGQTSQFVDCGEITATGETYLTLVGLTRVEGTCTDDGDSGGPYFSLDYLILGTNVGGDPRNTCPTAADYTWYQPIGDHISDYGSSAGYVLTSHGANAPTIAGMDCPESDLFHPSGTWSCSIGHYNSQGTTSVSWSVGTPAGEGRAAGTCSPGFSYSVTATVTNDYGFNNYPSNFTCPN